MLATRSLRHAGWPFTSLAPFALDELGRPLLLLSELAEHTRNLRADPRASLFIQDSRATEDPQAGARVTLLGTLSPVTDDGGAAAVRYVERHPQSAAYSSMADFHIWRMEIVAARLINGFAEMGWLDGDGLRAALAQ